MTLVYFLELEPDEEEKAQLRSKYVQTATTARRY